VVIEVPSDERNVDVARFANRFAVIERLENREETAVLLNLAGDGV
jgi:hypothetical protein